VIATPRLLSEQLDEAEKIGMSANEAAVFMSSLAAAGMLVARESDQTPSPEDIGILAQWNFADLLFHQRSRVGRTQRPFGGTYPFQGSEIAPIPFIRKPVATSIELLTPTDLSSDSAASFFDVLESRRSVREFDDDNPISKDELGELLWRTTRVRSLYEDEFGGVVDRPYPSGGAVHELDVYVAVRIVAELEPGLYRYDPIGNVLTPVSSDTPEFQVWMSSVPPWPQIDSRPQAVLVISARFGRTMWKYESMAYALTLKNAGVLLQTLYLGATAMNLGGCALGAGDSERFSWLAGLNPYEESSVAEFALGRPAADLTPSFTSDFAKSTIRNEGG
jgi:SagB-type dehydrogenase family enzyme